MKSLIHAAAEIQAFFLGLRWSFCFIGGVALQRWGQPRLTRDVDISLMTGFGNEREFIEPLLAKFKARIDGAEEFAVKHRVLLLETDSGVGIDIAFAALPFEDLIMERSSEYEFLPGISLRTCSAEDLIILKAFADRLQDWADIEGMVARQGDALSYGYVKEYLNVLCELKEAPDIMGKLEALMKAAGVRQIGRPDA